MATIFAAFGKGVSNNKGSIQNFGIIGITIATEELGKFVFFFCPCDYPNNKLYGSIFIWGPACVLLIIGYLANRRTWRLTTGLCHRTQGVGKGGKRIFHFLFIFASIGVKALIAPATWVVLAFLKGDYYACAHWPDPNDIVIGRRRFQLPQTNRTLPTPCRFNPNPIRFNNNEAEIIARNLRAESHIIGWVYVTTGMLLGVTIMFALRCRSNYSYEQSNYISRYRTNEVEIFEDQLDKKAKEQAQRIVDGYFAKVRSKEDWDKIAVINDKVTKSKRGRAIYSPLHKLVNKELREAEDAAVQLDLVCDAAQKKKVVKGKPSNGKRGGNENVQSGSAAGANVVVLPTTQFSSHTKKPCPQPQSVEMKVLESSEQKKKEDKPSPPTTVAVINKEKPDLTPEGAIVDPAAASVTKTTDASLSSDEQHAHQPESAISKSEEEQPASRSANHPSPSLTPNTDQSIPSKAPAAVMNESSSLPQRPVSVHLEPQDVTDPTLPSDVAPQPAKSFPNILTSPPAIPPPPSKQPRQQRPFSMPPGGGVQPVPLPAVRETSMGDFGGPVSRGSKEDLESSGESDDEEAGVIVFEEQELPSDVEVDHGRDGGYEPLLGNADDAPLISDE